MYRSGIGVILVLRSNTIYLRINADYGVKVLLLGAYFSSDAMNALSCLRHNIY